jgi:hypothetical protein
VLPFPVQWLLVAPIRSSETVRHRTVYFMSPAREEIFRPMDDKDTLVKLRRKRKRLAKTAFA